MKTNNFKIDDHEIGTGKTFVIAEVGSNHLGDLVSAKEHIAAAADAGADAVKFQSIKLDQLWHAPTKKIKALHKKIDFAEEWHEELIRYAAKKNILFTSSPTYLKAVSIMEEVDVPFFKIASAQVGTFPQLISAVAKTGKPTFFSTGIADYSLISRAVDLFKKHNHSKYAIFHCNSIYPTPYDAVNLGRMETYRRMFHCPIGFSDHTEGTAIVIAAVARGASMIEKHFKLEGEIDSPDAQFSITPGQFSSMVESIRSVESASGDKSRIKIEDSEEEFRESIRYKLVAKKKIFAGQSFSSADFDYLRSSRGIDATNEEIICDNFIARKDIVSGSLIHYTDLVAPK